MPMPEQNCSANFEQEVLPHLDSAYNLARWLTGNPQDAQDIVQEAYMRALRFYGGFRGGNVRAWLLQIVRNTFYTWVEQSRPKHPTIEFDEQLFGADPRAPNPEQALLQSERANLLRQALQGLPESFREVLILREFEGMSYKEISEVTGMVPGTVMSRLSRARCELRQSLASLANENTQPSSSREAVLNP
jgi:RNA polymerase sigma-70 factor (ECF subfamily)